MWANENPNLGFFLMAQKESAYARTKYSRAGEPMDLSNTEEKDLSPSMCEPCTMLKEVSVQQKTLRAEDTLMRCPTRRRFRVQVATATA